jgi:hypothetical protein
MAKLKAELEIFKSKLMPIQHGSKLEVLFLTQTTGARFMSQNVPY